MTDTQTAHTPGKLKIDGSSSICHGHGDYGETLDLKISNDLICGVSDGYNKPAEWQRANAARLVLCWNSHDELVAALNDCLSEIKIDRNPKFCRGLIHRAESTLANAQLADSQGDKR